MKQKKRFVAGNWKMNGSLAQNRDLLNALIETVKNAESDVVVFPPAIYIQQVATMVEGTNIKVGVQNISPEAKGAFTGEISLSMVNDFGCDYVLIGHSERRTLYGETNEDVAKKMQAVVDAKLTPVICVGETLEERESGRTEAVIKEQLTSVIDAIGIDAFNNAVIAYEPVWAIGTGKTATPEEADQVHDFIHCTLKVYDDNISDLVRVVYGGSVNASNVDSLFAKQNIDGALVGGASLEAEGFTKIALA
ncbi:MAG TPA: triose-phosphate isomerase [Candidatus Ignatzschineria merdigallinarum]|uniref:Triosephosphate isomerase n=1 Tax=Candidatus Ignatzschineria merdigallinarum TaxID=2838621 RepID=A0A9D1TUH4_9GAMM|nr:triose-phosphate isomerase [Candidatus Ignatzschineria merdigallinarum]